MSGAGAETSRREAPSDDRTSPTRQPARRRDAPYRYTAALAAEIEARWQDRWDAEGTFEAPEPGRPAGRAGQVAGPAEALRPGHVPVPVGRRAARRAPAGLHRHRRVRPVPADDRAQRAARPGLRRVRPARRAVRRADRPAPAGHHRGQHRDDARAAAPAGAGARPRGAASSTTDPEFYRWTQWIFLQIYNSWYDEEAGRARPIDELVPLLASGERRVPAGVPGVPRRPGPTWTSWTAAGSSTRTGWPTCRDAPVNWCPGLGTVLANEEVTADGRSDRGNFPVFKRNLRQWMMRITAYAAAAARPTWTGWTGRSRSSCSSATGSAAPRARGSASPAEAGDARGLHDPAGHAVRRHVHGARARAPDGGPAGLRRVARRRTDRLDRRSGDARATRSSPTARPPSCDRPGAADRGPRQDRRLHRRLRRQPGHRRADPGLRRRLRADGLRHRRDHGGARPGRARLGVRRAVRPADRADRRSRRRAGRAEAYKGDGPAINSANSEVSLDGLGVDEAKAADHRLAGVAGHRPAHGHLQAARLAVQPPALLGRAVPDRLRRARPAGRAARVDAAGRAARGRRLLAADLRRGRRRRASRSRRWRARPTGSR